MRAHRCAATNTITILLTASTCPIASRHVPVADLQPPPERSAIINLLRQATTYHAHVTRHPTIRAITLQACIFLTLGAVLNIIVAWGCVLAGPQAPRTPGEIAKQRLNSFLMGYLPECSTVTELDTRGYRQVSLSTQDGGLHEEGHWYADIAILAGWPLDSLCGEAQGVYRSSIRSTAPHNVWIIGRPESGEDWHPLPLIPTFPGFAINTLYYAVILWLLLALAFLLRRHQRKRRNLCPHCAYPQGTSTICTECGHAVAQR